MIVPRTNTENVLVARDDTFGGFPKIMIVPIVLIPVLFISMFSLAIVLNYRRQRRLEAQWVEEKHFRAMYGPRQYTTLQHAHSYHYQRRSHHNPHFDDSGFVVGGYDAPAMDSAPDPFPGGFGDPSGGFDSMSKQAPPSYSGGGGDSTSASASGGGGGMSSSGGGI